jgi:transposase InsO family protein
MSVSKICCLLGYTRQNYYKKRKHEDKEEFVKQQIKVLVCKVRKKLPRIGTRKLCKLIGLDIKSLGIKCGRDKLFDYMREMNLLIESKRRYVQTTFSKHWMRKYPNISKNTIINSPEQVWVSDITHLKTDEGNCYLSLITDAFSRKIVGFNVSDSMSAEQTVKALKMAIKGRIYPNNIIVHHSDRGLQYCSKEYVETAVTANINMSMTETSSPYDNALAERMNRTLKEEFHLYMTLKTKQQADRVVREAVDLYNSYRPHLALDFHTPNDVHKNPQLLGAIGDYLFY